MAGNRKRLASAVDERYQGAADTCRIRSQGRYAGYGNRSPCLLYGTDKKLWAGYAGSGLVACSPEGDSILTRYTTAQGLCSNFVTALAEDNDHSLWVAPTPVFPA